MDYYIDQSFLTLKDKFTIANASGTVCYNVTSPLFALTSRFSVFDTKGVEVAYLLRTVNRYIPGFRWYADKAHSKQKEILGILEDDPKLTKHVYNVEMLNDIHWRIEGDFMAWDFIFKNNDEVIATVKKEIFNLKDCYKLSVKDDADDFAAILCVIMIDNITHSSGLFRILK